MSNTFLLIQINVLYVDMEYEAFSFIYIFLEVPPPFSVPLSTPSPKFLHDKIHYDEVKSLICLTVLAKGSLSHS